MLTPFDGYGGKPYTQRQTKDLTFYKPSDTVKEQKHKRKEPMRKEKIQIPYINKENMTVKDMIACVEMLRSILEVFDRDCANDADYDEMLERVGGRVWQASKYAEVKE